MASSPPIGTVEFDVAGAKQRRCVDLSILLEKRQTPLPRSLMIVLENLARQALSGAYLAQEITDVAAWTGSAGGLSVPLEVSRVIFPDSSGLPALMDLAAARDVVAAKGGDPRAIEPELPVTLVVDHSLIVDVFGRPDAEARNIALEYARNRERYAFFKWAQQAFDNLAVVPPGAGIIHQVHLEKLARVVDAFPVAGMGEIVGPEFVLGCDSHTPMVNGLGLLAWGVGGIDAEAACLGQKYHVRIPRVVGVRLSGSLPVGATTTDLVLTVTHRLREVGVVGAFVEFFGPGLESLSVPDRATIANMAPEYGATVGYFPIDRRTIEYLEQSGREADHVALVEAYARASGLFVEDHTLAPDVSELVELDLGDIVPSVAGPKRPQDQVQLTEVKESFERTLTQDVASGGFGVAAAERDKEVPVDFGAGEARLRHGTITIAAITSCTNTSNPSVMIGAGLLARNARARGLAVPAFVKTSMAPGSRLVRDYLAEAGLLEPLEALGFHIVGYGCTTCSGKSGPIAPEIASAILENDLVAASVLSGNRNFEGRIHKSCRANYLASPPLVVAFALAGRIDIDFDREPLGTDAKGEPVMLADIWPDRDELTALVRESQKPEQFRKSYATLFDGSELWRKLESRRGPTFPWDPASTYIKRPPFFELDGGGPGDRIAGAKVLLMAADSLTTDHITPSGEILPDSLAGQYLIGEGVEPKDFNAVTQRRGNHEFMARVTFANQRMKNLLVPGVEGGFTRLEEDGEILTVFEAAERYRASGTPMLVLAGRDYGMGSSRDWAAKGPKLLGIAAVLAVSFERIHRANLIGMGILPLTFKDGETVSSLGLTGFESFSFEGIENALQTGGEIEAKAVSPTGETTRFAVSIDVASAHERDLLKDGGIFNRLLRSRMGAAKASRVAS
ncbi:aconitate hydratase AcnA [Afifella pfennigii]|uniref:aconitate hydratase AcnA n=1 Tax=Afifella pfennigii TaxID=209897 RepID=UPI00047C4992|nr:aconitate hydratase AcnA [Afifella pfennigii]